MVLILHLTGLFIPKKNILIRKNLEGILQFVIKTKTFMQFSWQVAGFQPICDNFATKPPKHQGLGNAKAILY